MLSWTCGRQMPRTQLLVHPLLLQLLANFAFGSIDEKQLYSDLLTNYNVLERPVSNSTIPLLIKIRLFLQQIVDVDEKNQVVEINAWIRYVSFIKSYSTPAPPPSSLIKQSFPHICNNNKKSAKFSNQIW